MLLRRRKLSKGLFADLLLSRKRRRSEKAFSWDTWKLLSLSFLHSLYIHCFNKKAANVGVRETRVVILSFLEIAQLQSVWR